LAVGGPPPGAPPGGGGGGGGGGAPAAAVLDDPVAVREAALAAGPGLDQGSMSVDVMRTGARGEPVTVSIRYASTQRVPLVAWLFPEAISMVASVAARQEFG